MDLQGKQSIQMESILEALIARPDWHARWLNTLSFLEFMGARKIARSATAPTLDETRLRHLAEEARHAHFFKMMIDRLGQSELQSYDDHELFCKSAAGLYFHGLDATVKRQLKARLASSPISLDQMTHLCYLYVTTIIEERAGGIYPLYNRLLEQNQINIRLQGIIGEEDRHLEDMQAAMSAHPNHNAVWLEELRQQEDKLFERFLGSMQRQVNLIAAAA